MAESVFPKPPPEGDGTPAPKPRRFWLRFTLGALVIVIVSATATSTSILLFIDSVAKALSHNNVYKNKLERVLSKVNGGEPENILILGSDKRANLQANPAAPTRRSCCASTPIATRSR